MNGSKLELKLIISADQTYKEYYVTKIDGKSIGNGQIIIPDKAVWFLPENLVSDVGTLFVKSLGLSINGHMAKFGIALSSTANLEGDVVVLSSVSEITSVEDVDYGCDPLEPDKYFGKFLIVRRGHCTFPSKAFWAQEAGALGLLVVSDKDTMISMAQSSALWDINLEDGNDMTAIPCFYFTKQASDLIIKNVHSRIILNGPLDSSYLYYAETKIANLVIKAERHGNPKLRSGYLYPGQKFECIKKCMGYICC